jgi:hypothetical protein
MSMTEDRGTEASVGRADMRLEVMVIPVSDVDREKEFYGRMQATLLTVSGIETTHDELVRRGVEADPNWPGWYAAYMIAEQTGTELPT